MNVNAADAAAALAATAINCYNPNAIRQLIRRVITTYVRSLVGKKYVNCGNIACNWQIWKIINAFMSLLRPPWCSLDGGALPNKLAFDRVTQHDRILFFFISLRQTGELHCCVTTNKAHVKPILLERQLDNKPAGAPPNSAFVMERARLADSSFTYRKHDNGQEKLRMQENFTCVETYLLYSLQAQTEFSFASKPLYWLSAQRRCGTSFIHSVVFVFVHFFVIRFFGIGFSFGIHEYSKRSSQTLINYYCQWRPYLLQYTNTNTRASHWQLCGESKARARARFWFDL